MNAKSVYKIPGGKLVKVSMEFENETINSILIHGDFFLHPENGLEKIEKKLIGKNIVEQELIEQIEKTVKENKIELFGLNARGLAQAILMAKESVKSE